MLIVGNGPSLRSTPLDQFVGTPSIGMNKIDLIFPTTRWRPLIIVCSNTMVVRQHIDKWRRQAVPLYLAWKARWFVPADFRRHAKFFHVSNAKVFSRDVSREVGFGHTVTYTALQFAHYMGADPVIIVGVDHSYASAGKPLQYKRMGQVDNNHFVSDYFSQGQLWGLPDLEGSEVDYIRARKAFEDEGRRIFDATVGGHLRVFKRITIDEAKERCRGIIDSGRQ